MITKLAYESMIKEVELTPKPGLVDRQNSGSHSDMDINTFYKSASAIKPYIKEFLKHNEFEHLRKVGLNCESSMFEATSGINTHKGMIFSLAVICGAINRADNFENLQSEIIYLCKDLVKNDLQKQELVKTNGEKFYKELNLTGIRGEAQSGFSTLFDIALPFYETHLDSFDEDTALKMTLLKLMSIIDDSTIYARGGVEGLEFVKKESKKILHVNNLDNNLEKLDKVMIQMNLSSGGSADLLGLTWFLHKIKGLKWNT